MTRAHAPHKKFKPNFSQATNFDNPRSNCCFCEAPPTHPIIPAAYQGK